MRIKIDKIISLEEVSFFSHQSEVEFITIKLLMQGGSEDQRALSISDAKVIKKELGNQKKFGLYLDDLSNHIELKEIFKEISFDFISLNSFLVNKLHGEKLFDIMDLIKSKNLFAFQHGISANYDEDPSWILSEIMESKTVGCTFQQIEIYSELTSAWKELSSNIREDELTLQDISGILQDNTIFYSLDFSNINIVEIFKKLSNHNIAFTLKTENESSNSYHQHSFQQIAQCLESEDLKYFNTHITNDQ